MREYSWLCLFVLWFGVAHGAIYRWVDGAGGVHFSDQPHTGSRPLHVRPDNVAGPSVSQLQLRRRLLRAYDEENARQKQKEASARKDAVRRERNCTIARNKLKTETDARYLFDYDTTGNRRVLTNRQRAAAEAEARAAVRRWCR